MPFARCLALAFAAMLLAPALARAQTPTPSPTPPVPVPNLVNLRNLAGDYPAGRSKVTLDLAPSYHGGARLFASSPSDLSLKIRISARIRTPSGRVNLDNLLTFAADGTVTGRELAPGIARHAPFRGIYTAAGRKITFTGIYAFGAAAGTFNGSVQRNQNGRLFVVYAVFAADQTDAIYTYRYSAIQPRKQASRPSASRR